MAPVADRPGRDRAQIVLVGALALAVSLVVLAVVLNSAIYTENLASRSDESGAGAAVDVRESVRDAVGGVAYRAATNNPGDDFATLYGTHYATAMDEWRPLAARQVVVAGRTLQVTPAGGMEGTRIVDDDPTTAFEPLGSGADSLGYSDSSWMVTSRAEVRNFSVADVATGDLPSADPTDPKGASTDVFYAEVREVRDDRTVEDSWRVAVYENTAGDVEVLVYEVGAGVAGTCSATGSARVDLTGATVNGERCPPLTFFEAVDEPTEVHYVNGGQIEGTYALTVDRAGHGPGDPLKDAVDTANYGDQCSKKTYSDATGTYPYASAAIYSATVDYRYVSESVTYDTRVRAARGEPGPAPVHPVVTEFDVTDAPDDDNTFTVDWSAADPNADLDAVTVRLVDGASGTVVDTAAPSVSDPESDGGSVTLQDTSGYGPTYRVEITATDAAGNDRRSTETHNEDGDDSGCPP